MKADPDEFACLDGFVSFGNTPIQLKRLFHAARFDGHVAPNAKVMRRLKRPTCLIIDLGKKLCDANCSTNCMALLADADHL